MPEEFPRPTRSLVGRVAIVSGAGAAGDGIGNGRASAILLAEAGANVVCVDLEGPDLTDLAFIDLPGVSISFSCLMRKRETLTRSPALR